MSNPGSTRASPSLLLDLNEEIADQSLATFNKEDFMFLRDFHTIVDMMLNSNNAEEISKAVAHLDERFVRARQILQELPGLHHVQEEQETILQNELQVLEGKKQQLQRYTSLEPFRKGH